MRHQVGDARAPNHAPRNTALCSPPSPDARLQQHCPPATLSTTAACTRSAPYHLGIAPASPRDTRRPPIHRPPNGTPRLVAAARAALHFLRPALPRWPLCPRVTGAAADALSRLVSIGGVALALQLPSTSVYSSPPSAQLPAISSLFSVADSRPFLDPAACFPSRRCDWHASRPI